MQYADDAALFSKTREGLQEGLDALYDYCQKWELVVNIEKTKVMVFRRGGMLSMEDHWFYGDCRLDIVDRFCYLGIIFSTSGKFNIAQATLAEQASKAVFSLKNKLRDMYDPQPDFCCMLFDKLIVPILNYGCEVWGFCRADQVERVHMKYCKSVLRMRQSSGNYFCYGELGRRPLRVLRMHRILKYWLGIVMTKRGTLMRKLYRIMYESSEADNALENWASFVRNVLCNLGFYQVWLEQGVGHTDIFLKLCKQRLNDQYTQEWSNEVATASDANLYRNLKVNLIYSEYLSKITAPKLRYGLLKFLTRNHNLLVVTDRWRGRPYEARLCLECDVLDDEYHCVIECRKFTDLRRRYINKYFLRRPSMYKFIKLVTSNNVRTLVRLALFITKTGCV